ncbi:hypothetical protein VDGE_30757 [Verticillium dahliae]|uniref:Uncharacterized protein n=1 Tax=Verticillium dahliae TaxID=27337 RepID=A0A444SA08_VERDA|nr:hypothetical protein VDGE_30757 [Verticillium dahliae]
MAARRNHEFYELSEIRPGSHSSQATANLRATTSDPHTEPFSLKQFWSQHVSCVVDFDKCRDHLGVSFVLIVVFTGFLIALDVVKVTTSRSETGG